MRAQAICVALLATAIAGCSTPTQERTSQSTEEFKAMALAAPDRLKEDMGPDGALVRVVGDMRMNTTMAMDGDTMEMRSHERFTQDIYDGDSYRIAMHSTTDAPGMSMQTFMTILCTPERIVMRMEAPGFPDGAGGDGDGGDGMAGTVEDLPNDAGTCGPDVDPSFLLDGGSGGPVAPPGMFGPGLSNLTFMGITREGSRDVALYEVTVHVDGNATMDGAPGGDATMDGNGTMGPDGEGMAMPGFDAQYEIRATLDGDRISRMVMTGTMRMDGGEPFVGGLVMDLQGTMDFEYGERGPMPGGLLDG